MSDDDLRALLASPALDLAPPADLLAGVRRGARRVRRRRAAGGAVAVVLALAGVVSVGSRPAGPSPGQVALAPDSRFPDATTPVAVLERLNGGEVVTFFEGARWCTASSRADTTQACSRNVGTVVQPFAFLRGQGTESLSVDADGLVAGLLGTGAGSVRVTLADGRVLAAATTAPGGFVRPVWWLRVPRGAAVSALTAYDPAGQVLATRPMTR